MRREIIFSLAAVCLITFIAGCRNPKPKPHYVEPNPVPAPPTIVHVPSTNTLPLPVSRPRPADDASNNMASNILAWDAVAKEYQAKAGETNAPFTFNLTNVSTERVMIYDTSTTCECTVAQLPSKPWTLAPGAGGQIHATLDLHNRTDAVTNFVIVFTSKGNRLLTVRGIPAKP